VTIGSSFARLLAAMLITGYMGSAMAAPRFKLAAGPERGTQYQVAKEFARLVARPADVEIDVGASAGAVDNLQRLRDEPGMRFALLPSDTMHAYMDAAARGNVDATLFVAPLRVVAPLYEEHLYFIARSDSALNSVHDIRDARINVGPLGSSSALSATTLFRLMFGNPMADDRTGFLGHEEALAKLITDKTVDVVAMVGEQPAKLLADMRPEARRYVKLLRFDAAHPTAAAALKVYSASAVRPASYPNLLSDNLPTVALRIYLVAYMLRPAELDVPVGRLTQALCQNLPRLKAEGHPVWREVELAGKITLQVPSADGNPQVREMDLSEPALAVGWHYAKASQRELRRCSNASAAAPPGDVCSQQDRVLGLCE
jgi:TRAP-type uncharacterized transport system substrate-binding protein